jgi:flagellar hook assembly protein FlgD
VIVSKGSLTITLPQPAVIEKLLIYDLKGRLIYTMPFNTSAVTQRIFWDGKAGMGSRLKPGTYVVCIKTKTGILKSPFMWK